MASNERSLTAGVLSKAYRAGTIQRSDYLAGLINMNYSPDNASLIIATDEATWGIPTATLTTDQILNSWEQGFYTIEYTQERLRKLGWTVEDMNTRLSFSVLDMLKAKHLSAAEADKLWESFGQGPEERAKLAVWYGGSTA
jgi:hypothetical protein